VTVRERGQAAVELAVALPVVAVALLLVLQAGLVVRAQILVVHAAREGARAAAVGDEPPEPDGLGESRTTSTRHVASGRVRVEVRHLVATDLPLVGVVLPDVLVRGTATMRVE
jgi:hypothetical protein